MRTGRILRTTLLSGVVALTLTGTGPVAAQVDDEAPPDPVGGPLEIGPWAATANASGRATANQGGVQFDWVGGIPAQFEFTVADGGGVEGTWTHQGAATFSFDGAVQGQRIDATANLTMTGGGSVSGSSSRLTLNGNATTTGTFSGTVAGQSMSMPVNNPQQLPTLTVDVRSTVCDEAYGEWAYTVQDGFTGEGFSASFGGHWTGYRDTAEVQAHIDELIDKAAMGGDDVPDFTSMTPLLASAAELLWRYNDFVDDFPNWAVDDVIDATEWADLLMNGLRNLSDCDQRLMGEDQVEIFTNGLTLMIQQLVINVFQVSDVDSGAWQQLAQIAARTGAIGAGAQYPDDAVAAEAALIQAGAEILTANLDDEGYINVTDDTKRVMATGAAMGWEFEVNGETYNARDTFDDYLEAGGTE